jgi:GNAT superfamily N-acetyltransferase
VKPAPADLAALERMLGSMRSFHALVGRASKDAFVLDRDGLMAAVVPAVPERSVMNSVIYHDPKLLASMLDDIAAAYEGAGVKAWTVWVPAWDKDTSRLLKETGHVLDADPAAMIADLDELDIDEAEPFSGTKDDVAALNDRAYPFDGQPFSRGLSSFPEDEGNWYVARDGGKPMAGLATFDHDGDCGIELVATLPQARGRGLATRLMRRALIDARERGCTTSSLQATKLGEPVYARLGYRSIGPLEMWERRR